MPIHRRFVSDIRQDNLIPTVEWPELAALESERRRLADALRDAERSGPGVPHDEEYIAARTRALRAGTELPTQPPTPADLTAAQERHRRDVAAAEAALLRVGDEICAAVANHPEWEGAISVRAETAVTHAAALRAEAAEAERRAQDLTAVASWFAHAGNDELYVFTPTGPVPQEDDLIMDPSDPRIASFIEMSRTGGRL